MKTHEMRWKKNGSEIVLLNSELKVSAMIQQKRFSLFVWGALSGEKIVFNLMAGKIVKWWQTENCYVAIWGRARVSLKLSSSWPVVVAPSDLLRLSLSLPLWLLLLRYDNCSMFSQSFLSMPPNLPRSRCPIDATVKLRWSSSKAIHLSHRPMPMLTSPKARNYFFSTS